MKGSAVKEFSAIPRKTEGSIISNILFVCMTSTPRTGTGTRRGGTPSLFEGQVGTVVTVSVVVGAWLVEQLAIVLVYATAA